MTTREGPADTCQAWIQSEDYQQALAEAHRVPDAGGRRALSDVVIEGEPPDIPPTIAQALCLTGHRDRETVFEHIRAAGFTVTEQYSHRDNLLAMRDELAGTVDYERLLGLLGETGQRALDGIETLESAVESDRVDYVSLVATRDRGLPSG